MISIADGRLSANRLQYNSGMSGMIPPASGGGPMDWKIGLLLRMAG